MSRIIDRLVSFARRKSFRYGLVGILGLLLAAVAVPHVAFAGDTNSASWLDLALSYFAAIALAAAELIGKLVIAVLDVTIPVMQYQGFTTSPVVVAGWAIVRDVVNMFFVIVLIVIAMGTIFGHSRFQWKQQVPKLMIFAIVINFSKTLCGLMIDFAQVIMLTFANALKDIAGGNFIQLLGLGDIFALSEKGATIAGSATGTGPGAGPFDWFAAGVAAVLMMLWVLAVVIMLLFVLIYRVVMLWILIVIAPLAWFMGGQSVFKSDAYAEWWKNFICYTAIGPVITFFLWLTLAVAGSGFIAANDPGLSAVAPAGDLSSNTADFVTKIFEWQRLTSFVVGMAMLMVGFDAASKICHGVKGPGFQSLLSTMKPGTAAQRYLTVGRKAGKGISIAGRGGKAAGVTAAGIGGALAGGDLNALRLGTTGESARAKGLKDLSKKKWVPTAVSTTLAREGDVRRKELSEKLKKASDEKFKGMSGESKTDYLNRLAEGGTPMVDELGRDAAMGLLAEAIQDPKMRERLEASGALATLYGRHQGDLKDYFKGTATGKALDEFDAARPDLTGNVRVLNSMEDVEKLDPAALARLKGEADRGTELGNAFKERMQAVRSNTKKKFSVNQTMPDGTVVTAAMGDQVVTVSAWDHYEGGMGSVKKQKAWKEGMTGVYEGMSNPVFEQVSDADLVRHASKDLLARRQGLDRKVLSSRDAGIRDAVAARPEAYRLAAQSALGLTYANGRITGVDVDKLESGLRSNPSALMNMSTTDIETDPGLSTAIASAIDEDVLAGLMKQYKKTTVNERGDMDAAAIENTFRVMEQGRDAAVASGNQAAADRMNALIQDFNDRIVAVSGSSEGVIANLQDDVARANQALQDERRKGAKANADTVRRVNDDIRRLQSRISRHQAMA